MRPQLALLVVHMNLRLLNMQNRKIKLLAFEFGFIVKKSENLKIIKSHIVNINY